MDQFKFIEQMNANSSEEKLAVIIRHADRDKIPQGSFGNDVLINQKGIGHSILFGQKLKDRKINRIYSSPIPRCVETGKFISEGYGKEFIIHESKALGAPGLHITDDQEAGKYYLGNGIDGMYHDFINNKPIPGVTSVSQYKDSMTEFLLDHTTEKGITLFITHDILIAFYHYALFGRVFTKPDWIGFLTGIIIKK